MKIKMTLKSFFAMIIVMLSIIITYFYFSGFFSVQSTLTDVLSFSGRNVVAKSETWSFCIPDDENNNFYFLCNQNKKFKPYISGMIFYEETPEAKQHTQKLHDYVFADRHFFVGEKRWIVSRKSQTKPAQNVAFAFKIMWEPFPYGNSTPDVREEYLFSDGLTTEQLAEAKRWLDLYGIYVRPYEFYPQ